VTPLARIEAALTVLRELRAEATPGPWSARKIERVLAEEDADLIVAMCNPAVLDAVEAVLEGTKFNIESDFLGYTHATVAAGIRLADALLHATTKGDGS
jgi:hypothetical protein